MVQPPKTPLQDILDREKIKTLASDRYWYVAKDEAGKFIPGKEVLILTGDDVPYGYAVQDHLTSGGAETVWEKTQNGARIIAIGRKKALENIAQREAATRPL